MRLSERLQRAKDLLLERGWCQKTFETDLGELCVMGALNVVTVGSARANRQDTTGEQMVVLAEAWEVLHDAIGDDVGIASWNDHKGRTPEHVLCLFDRAIAIAEAREAVAQEVPDERASVKHAQDVKQSRVAAFD